MTDKNNTSVKSRDINEMRERRELFKQVAIATIASRQSLAITADAGGDKISTHFVDTVSLITEGILEAAQTFSEK